LFVACRTRYPQIDVCANQHEAMFVVLEPLPGGLKHNPPSTARLDFLKYYFSLKKYFPQIDPSFQNNKLLKEAVSRNNYELVGYLSSIISEFPELYVGFEDCAKKSTRADQVWPILEMVIQGVESVKNQTNPYSSFYTACKSNDLNAARMLIIFGKEFDIVSFFFFFERKKMKEKNKKQKKMQEKKNEINIYFK